MAQGDATSTGYAEGTPTRFLSSHATARTNGATVIDAQDVTHALVGPISGRKALTTAGTREALAGATKARQVLIQYAEGSTGTICIGGSGVVAALATRNGFSLLGPGDWVELEVNDLAEVYIDSTVSGDAVTFNYWTL